MDRLGAKTHELIAASVSDVKIEISGLEELVLDAHAVEDIGQLELLVPGGRSPRVPPTRRSSTRWPRGSRRLGSREQLHAANSCVPANR